MKILHISTSDLGHGAGIAAYNLNLGLNQLGHNSKMLVVEKLSSNPYVYSVKPTPTNFREKLIAQGNILLEKALNQLTPQNLYSSSKINCRQHPLIKEADIINLHNLHWHDRNFSILLLKNICKIKPVVWTWHDMWPITGHCIYSFDCDRWKIGCGKCPDLNSYISLKIDTTATLHKIKKSIYSKSKFTVITPAQWLKELASASPLLHNKKIVCIPNGINNQIYKSQPKQQARQALGIEIEPERQIVLFSAGTWTAQNKGYPYFEKAILNLKVLIPNLFLLGFGQGDFSETLKTEFETLALGYIDHPKLKALVYSAADIFVFPTIADNLPNAVLESMACGTPVVSFNTGGVPDMIEHMETGYIAERGNIEDLANGILTLLNNDDLRESMAKKGIERIAKNFTSELQARRYLEIYQKEIESRLK
jgi:glycosyltransferase involved in cell wall biosynthesis